MSGFPSAGYYTVQAKTVGADLVASLYAQNGDIFIGSCSIVCSKIVQAFACIGLPIVPSAAVDSTRSGNIDSSSYQPNPLRVPAGQAYSVLWVGAAGQTASMSVQVVAGP